MSRLGVNDHGNLIELWRRYSPQDLEITRPRLRPDLEALTKQRLPARPKAVLFDVYGTLLASAAGGEPNLSTGDTTEGETARRELEAELKAVGYPGGSWEFHKALVNRIRAHHQDTLPLVPHPEVDLEALAEEILGSPLEAVGRRILLLYEASVNACAPMPGASPLLTQLSESGIRLGIVSNAQFFTPLLMEALLGRSPEALGFEAELTMYSYTQGIAKPDPRLFEPVVWMLGASGVAPGEILFVGNSSVNDVAPARTLGLLTALFAGDTRSFRPSEPGTPGALPDLVLTSLEELPEKIRL